MTGSLEQRWRNLGMAAGAVTAGLFAVFDLYQWAAAYAGDRFHNDFTFYYAAARIGLAHGWGSIYDLNLQQVELNTMGSGITIAQQAVKTVYELRDHLTGPLGGNSGTRTAELAAMLRELLDLPPAAPKASS